MLTRSDDETAGGLETDRTVTDVHVCSTSVLRVVALDRTQALVYLEGLGWRRLRSADGGPPTRALIGACCRARLARRPVEVRVSDRHLSAVAC